MKVQPIREFRHGLIIVRIWRRTKWRPTGYKITIVRLFRNGDRWHESTRFSQGDIPIMRLILDEAYGWLLTQIQIAGEGKKC